MTGLATPAESAGTIVTMATLFVVLLALALATARWPLWLAAILVAAATLGTAVVLRGPDRMETAVARTAPRLAGPSPPADRNRGSGVAAYARSPAAGDAAAPYFDEHGRI